ncbi:MAG: 3-hydroxybutyryl-CoA dehydrogenase [Deltaproteobacteria bacterium RBG_16_54_11]|nr:MAG: 3-hydroxybutyryl-CoA dehydrogenase [Deltaproteobacteria bacterium RBG_16_54_11]
MEIKTIGVIGAGQMGGGIAQVAAAGGFQVIINDVAKVLLDKGLTTIGKNLDRLVQKERITESAKKEALARIKGTLLLKEMAGADFIVEAVTEDERIKLAVFKELDEICRPGVLLASNTSSIPITRIASATKRPEIVIGMHFMNPVPVMRLVEIIKGLATSEGTFQVTKDLAIKMGKTPVEANDYPGFISNRILMPMINEAIFALYQGVGPAEAIDQVMKLGMNHPMGPLELADLIGLDTCLAIMNTLYEGFGDPKYFPCPLLKKYVDAGYAGKKTGRGFYSYGQRATFGSGEKQ